MVLVVRVIHAVDFFKMKLYVLALIVAKTVIASLVYAGARKVGEGEYVNTKFVMKMQNGAL